MRKFVFMLVLVLFVTILGTAGADVENMSMTHSGGVYTFTVLTTADVKAVGILDEAMVPVSVYKGVRIDGDKLSWELTVTPISGGSPYGKLTLMIQGKDGKWTQAGYAMASVVLGLIPTTPHGQSFTQPPVQPTAYVPPAPTAAPAPAVHPYAPYWPYYGNSQIYGYAPVVMTPYNSGAKAATLSMRLATRSGPATEFSEPGSFLKAGDPVTVISYTADENNVVWCQVEFNAGGRTYRAYTGLKRIAGLADISVVPQESPLMVSCGMAVNQPAYFGPGTNYAKYKDLTLRAGFSVTLTAIEGDWAQVQYFDTGDGKEYRVWIPVSAVTPR